MKKKVFAVLLALVMCIGLMPVIAAADEGPVEIRSTNDLKKYFPGDSDGFLIDRDAVITGTVETYKENKPIVVSESAVLTIGSTGYVEAGVINNGSLVVEAGGVLSTTQGSDIVNNAGLTVKEGGTLISTMGGQIVNDKDMVLDGEFDCGYFVPREDMGDSPDAGGPWFRNTGAVTGTGLIRICPVFEADEEMKEKMISTVKAMVSDSIQVIVGNEEDKPERKWDNPFKDVAEGDWYYDAVRNVFDRGIMTGKRDDYFGAADILLREEFATILYRMTEEEDREEVPYSPVYPDVPDKQWYTQPALWARSIGVITGSEFLQFITHCLF